MSTVDMDIDATGVQKCVAWVAQRWDPPTAKLGFAKNGHRSGFGLRLRRVFGVPTRVFLK